MVTNLLSRHPQVATTELEQARDAVAGRFCSHRLDLTRRDGRLDMLHNAAAIGPDVTLNYLRYGDEVRITPGRFEDFFLVQVPLAGSARVRVGDRVVHSNRRRGSLGSPTEPVDMVWSDGCEQLLVYLRRRAVEELACAGSPQEGAAPPVVFDAAVDLTAPALRSWLRLVWLALDDLEAGGALFRSPLAATHFEQTLVSGLLAAQPSTVASPQACTEPRSRVVRTVMGLIEGEPERPWRLADLAAGAGVSARTLQDAFHRELDSTPLEHLRRVRLDRARRDLLDAEPSATSVTDVAARWGFFHLGRFSQTYRAAFHELPSQTLNG